MAKIVKKLSIESIRLDPMPISMSDFAFMQPVDPRRRPEIADSQMIQEDHHAMSNLPRQAINRQWNPGKYMPHYWMESEVEGE